jgi:hypothetical protein
MKERRDHYAIRYGTCRMGNPSLWVRSRCWHPAWYGASVPPWGPPTKEEEIRFLEEEANFLREGLSQIEKRLEELKK